MTIMTADIYDLGSVRRFLGQNCELPDSEEELLVVLSEYHAALHALATRVQATPPGMADPEPAAPATNADGYDLNLIWQFLAQDREPPGTEHGLLVALSEYRAVLHALVAGVQATQPGLADCSPASLAAGHVQR